ncbi:MAG: hypothetical protein ACYTG5_14840 [Planctomycetota bacterium]|jgi:hypothetical protein
MKLLTAHPLALILLAACMTTDRWPMVNDPAFDATVQSPTYENLQGPRILLDGGHHNFFIQWDFIEPFAELAEADGYRAVIDDQIFSPEYLAEFDIVMIITALPFDFTTKIEVTTEKTFADEEIAALHDWVETGGSLLVFSEHAPFDQAINSLLERFGITSSVGTVIDTKHHDKTIGNPGFIVFSRENGFLNEEHPITNGRNESEAIDSVLTFGGSSLTGEGYANLFRLSPTAENQQHPTGVGPFGMGNSQALAGSVGEGKIVAFGDSNGFTAMSFKSEDGSLQSVGMNTANHEWKQFVLNVLHWLSGELLSK